VPDGCPTGELRDVHRRRTITLACLRLGYPADHAKGSHLLPDEVTAPLKTTLVRSLAEPELRRALTATISVVTNELERSDPALATRLRPMLADLAINRAESHRRPPAQCLPAARSGDCRSRSRVPHSAAAKAR
jgi:hypothetical protein